MKPVFQQLRILYYALLAGQVLFAAVVYFLLSGEMTAHAPAGTAAFQWLVPPIILAGAGAAYFLNRQRQAQLDQLTDLPAKAAHYRNSVIIRSALMEGANFFAVIAALVDVNMTYLLYFAVGLLAFIYFRPSVGEFSRTYALSAAEREQLKKI